MVRRSSVAQHDYTKIAKNKIVDPGGDWRRWLIYGRYKTGKTHFLTTAPNMLILDPENGTEEVPLGKAKVWHISQWEDIAEFQDALRSGAVVHPATGDPFDWLGVDNMSRLGNMALRYVMKMGELRDLDRIPGMVEKRDYGKAGELLKGLLFNLHSMPLNIIYTAGDRMDTGGGWNDEDDDAEQIEARYVPDLPKGARASLNQIVSGIGRIYTVKIDSTKTDKKIVQRRLWINLTDRYDTGFRSQHLLPDYLRRPTVSRLESLVNNGKV